ncbi:MAG: hypothetical protein APG12_01370 [Candidatus Methanofastidiosum methylothiophilum]|uniref:DUF2148 domain-containing protein n=1 Tax=Candidatus Methanofastidiosum methylothiophilum TaxID=1705564 RepID=A0A150IJJ3_9EURY|nr:MAG: hypothetical protein APG10_01094 [Candidatus Methanofastidiosum methylthiophilus]KYC47412.1 MAG: hypothetical protein APG11_01183 [Candidatus Methanofastidiosum methylthiophilus]KYC49596.1 MAG: hypothetical protein APG12_01370 [Candidatus Methanofastidiosum methylthiophilus]
MTGQINESLKAAAGLIEIAAITAPKGKGVDDIKTKTVYKGSKEHKELVERMKEYGDKKSLKFFHRDSKNTLDSDAIVLVSVTAKPPLGLNCGMCGYDCNTIPEKKKINDYFAPICAFALVDLGIALGSASKTAQILNLDNRIMYSIGATAVEMCLIDGDVVMGIPLSVSSKNIYFDR